MSFFHLKYLLVLSHMYTQHTDAHMHIIHPHTACVLGLHKEAVIQAKKWSMGWSAAAEPLVVGKTLTVKVLPAASSHIK